MHFSASSCKLPIESLRIGLIRLWKHHNCPHRSKVVIYNHAVFCLLKSFPTLLIFKTPWEVHLRLLKREVSTNQVFYLAIWGPVSHIVGDPGALRIHILADVFVNVDCQVEESRVPVSILVVDKQDLRGIFKRAKNVSLVCIVVAENDIFPWHETAKHFLIAWLEVGLFDTIDCV